MCQSSMRCWKILFLYIAAFIWWKYYPNLSLIKAYLWLLFLLSTHFTDEHTLLWDVSCFSSKSSMCSSEVSFYARVKVTILANNASNMNSYQHKVRLINETSFQWNILKPLVMCRSFNFQYSWSFLFDQSFSSNNHNSWHLIATWKTWIVK